MAIVDINALGTVFLGLLHSSARCSDASIPAYMKHGVTMPVRKQTPSFHPVLFSNFVQTNEDDCFSDNARQVTTVTRNVAMVSATEEVSTDRVSAG